MERREVHLSGPDVGPSDIAAVVEVLQSRYLSLGPKLPEFEKALATRAGRKHAVAVNSGTSALHCIMVALGVGPGDTVLTTPFSFVASANCILMAGATPEFVDIVEPTYNVDLDLVAARLRARRKKPKAVIVVDVFGQPSNWGALEDLCRDRGVALVEDSCEAIGSRCAGRSAGSFGDAGCFAFYPNKQMTTGEGGCVVTDSDEVAALCSSLRNQGRGAGGAWLQHERLGYNYRLSDINCALGIAQLAKLDGFVKARQDVARRYGRLLAKVEGVSAPVVGPDVEVMSWFVYVVRLADSYRRADRDRIIEGLKARGVGCNNYFAPIHLMPFYQERFGFKAGDFKVTERAADRTIALPFHNRLGEDDQRYVVETLRSLL